MNTQIIRAPAFQRPSGKLYLAAAQFNLINTIPTLVLLDSIGAGYKDGIENTVTHRITPGVAGFYSIKGKILLNSVQLSAVFSAFIYINGVNRDTNHFSAAQLGLLTLPCGMDIYLSAIDYVELWVTSVNGDNTADIVAGVETTFLSVQRVR